MVAGQEAGLQEWGGVSRVTADAPLLVGAAGGWRLVGGLVVYPRVRQRAQAVVSRWWVVAEAGLVYPRVRRRARVQGVGERSRRTVYRRGKRGWGVWPRYRGACQLVGLSICWEVGERGFRGWRVPRVRGVMNSPRYGVCIWWVPRVDSRRPGSGAAGGGGVSRDTGARICLCSPPPLGGGCCWWWCGFRGCWLQSAVLALCIHCRVLSVRAGGFSSSYPGVRGKGGERARGQGAVVFCCCWWCGGGFRG